MHIALKIVLYAAGSIAFLGVVQQFTQKDETKTSPGTTGTDTPVVGTEKAVMNTKVSAMDLTSDQMKAVLSTVTKDISIGSNLIGVVNSAKIMV